jgi:uncharacterized surface protein with fasciclin (FAS1) repeats
MKIYKYLKPAIIYLTGYFLLISCNSDDVGENLYTFTDKMMGQFIESDSTLSEFDKLIEKTKIKGLLNSYGAYTCFAPSDDALKAFYKEKGKKSLDDFTPDSLKLIAYDHIINGAVVNYVNFNDGRIFQSTMSDRYLAISFNDLGQIFVNKTSAIMQKDILVHNGVIHKIDKVLDPVRSGITEVISRDSTFSIFYKALVATGLGDSLLRTIDESYSMSASMAKELEDAVNTTVSSERHAPVSRKFGYTLLMESNQTMRKNGITDLESMKKFAAGVYNAVYPDDAWITDITNRSNSLNRFIAYHIINKELGKNKFILDYDTQHQSRIIDLYEYIEPMCPNSLIEVKIQRSTGEVNLFNYNPETNTAVRLVPVNVENNAINGVYHEIDNMLIYSSNVEAMLSSKRIRFDFASLFPELTNNKMRGRPSDNNNLLYRNALPKGYLERLECTDQTIVCYSNAHDKLMNYMGDEVFLVVQNGKLYDFTVTTPPVPAGTYEIRFGYQSNGRRGVAQFYVDGVPSGVPINLNTSGTDVSIGYIKPGDETDDPFGFENDKMMRNRGYMKGPNSYKAVVESWYSGSSARHNASNLRKILGTYSYTNAGSHKIMVKGLSGGQFQVDYIEFVPTSILESEDIY